MRARDADRPTARPHASTARTPRPMHARTHARTHARSPAARARFLPASLARPLTPSLAGKSWSGWGGPDHPSRFSGSGLGFAEGAPLSSSPARLLSLRPLPFPSRSPSPPAQPPPRSGPPPPTRRPPQPPPPSRPLPQLCPPRCRARQHPHGAQPCPASPGTLRVRRHQLSSFSPPPASPAAAALCGTRRLVRFIAGVLRA